MQPGITFYMEDTLKNLHGQIIDQDAPDIFEFDHLINNDEFVTNKSLMKIIKVLTLIKIYCSISL